MKSARKSILLHSDSFYDIAATTFVEETSQDALLEMGPYLAHVHVRNNRALAPGEQAERYKDSVSGQRYIDTVFDGGEVELRPILAELNRMRPH